MNIQPPIPVWLAWGENASDGAPLLAGSVVAGEIVAIGDAQGEDDMADEILTTDEVTMMLEKHRRLRETGWCRWCSAEVFPCDAARLATAYLALQARLPLLEAALAVLRAGRRFKRAITGNVPDEDEIVAALNERDAAWGRYDAADAQSGATSV